MAAGSNGFELSEEARALLHPVVAVGVPPGGPGACFALFRCLPPDTGMAFLVAPCTPEEQRQLTNDLAGCCAMPVAEVTAPVRPEADRIYVLPANQPVRFQNGSISPEAPQSESPVGFLDDLLISLAASLQSQALGVVLAGARSDGAIGLRAIKERGGIAFLETPDPPWTELRDPIPDEYVDRILPPAKIALELTEIGRQIRLPAFRALAEGGAPPGGDLPLRRILDLLGGVVSVDFHLYKPGLVRAAIARRMLLQHVANPLEYAARLKTSSKELLDLHEEVLNGGTRFFRDPAVFAALEERILPEALAHRHSGDPLRIWIAGCSSGEEVYSLAICVLEYLAAREFDLRIQIFGTDARPAAIEAVRSGVYPALAVQAISPARLRNFFVKEPPGYRIAGRVRELCVFARHDIYHDPPFSRMDLVCCRNLLNSFVAQARHRVLETIHHALRPDGLLLLGSEEVAPPSDMFRPIDERSKVFARIGADLPLARIVALPRHLAEEPAERIPVTEAELWDNEVGQAADRLVLDRFGPPGVVINEDMRILQARGDTSAFFEMPQGQVSLNAVQMLRPEIAGPVNQALQSAIERDRPVRVKSLRVTVAGKQREFILEVTPFPTPPPQARCFLVLFAPPEGVRTGERSRRDSVHGESQTMDDLRRRLADLESLLDSANLPLLRLNRELRIEHFTAGAQRALHLSPTDIGRPLPDVRPHLAGAGLTPLVRQVLDTLAPAELELRDGEECLQLLRASPYRTADNRIDGVVLELVRVDDLRRREKRLAAARDFAQARFEKVPAALAVLDSGLRIRQVNEAFRKLAGVGNGDLYGRWFSDLARALWGVDDPLSHHLECLRDAVEEGAQFAIEQATSGEQPGVFEIRGRKLTQGDELSMLVMVEDVTARKNTERSLALEGRRLAAQAAATATELLWTQDKLRALAAGLFQSQEDERRRVARELHDDICQRLALLEIDAQQLEPQIDADPRTAHSEMVKLRTSIGDLSEEVRRISHALHPSILEDLGIAPAVRSMAEDFQQHQEMIVTFQARGVPDSIPPEIATGLYRIAQEALHNVAKHAGKTHVKVLLEGENGRIRLQVIDFGQGFDPESQQRGLGLIGMEERARIMQGSLSVASEPGEGTRVTVEAPLPLR